MQGRRSNADYEYSWRPCQARPIWFFTADAPATEERRTLATTLGSYDISNKLRRYEGKGTYSLTGHRIQGAYTRSTDSAKNTSQNATIIMDRNSLFDATRDLNLFTLGYNGVLSPSFSLEARLSVRNDTTKDFGGRSTDLIAGTLLLDGSRSLRRYWAPTFCGVCDPEERDNQNIFVKGSYFSRSRGTVRTTACSVTTGSTTADSRTTIRQAVTIGFTARRPSST